MGDIERLDRALTALAREEGALRLRLGQLLEVMGRGAVFELGFSSLGAYALERCERSVRWVEAARCLARRLEALPNLRRAAARGDVSWTMGELLAQVATAADETRWLEQAEGRTVRQMREVMTAAVAAARASASVRVAAAIMLEEAVGPKTSAEPAGAEAPSPSGTTEAEATSREATSTEATSTEATALAASAETVSANDASVEAGSSAGEFCTLTCTVDREDAWLFEATRCLLEQLGEHGVAGQCEALLAEAQGALLSVLPRELVELSSEPDRDAAQRRWVQQLCRWRRRAEVACEKNIPRRSIDRARGARSPSELVLAASLGMAPLEHVSCRELDRQVRSLSSTLARHDLELSRLALRLHRADGWRRLGYATEAQYARERLGLSRSALAARRGLALRLEKLPSVAAALGSAEIGVEAALQVVRIATSSTEAAWVERARRRTIKHLREEVAAALTAVRISGERDCPPPEDAEMAAFQELEQAVVSGRFAEHGRAEEGEAAGGCASSSAGRRLSEPTGEVRRTWCIMLGSLASWLANGLQMSAAAQRPVASRVCRLAGRVTLRLRMLREACVQWRSLEAQARRWLPRGMSWLRFACLAVWHAWRHLLGTEVAYGHIYVRDRFRCMSPVCNRRDVTPHHLQFRSAGGSDEDHNIGSVCTWCHLRGVHGGRIRAIGTADHIRWELGPKSGPSLVVHGRERLAA